MHSFVARAFRYGLALAGPVSNAGGQFALSLVLLQKLSPTAFGTFSFLLVTSQLTMGLSSALLCAPYPSRLSSGDAREAVTATFVSANLLFSSAAIVAFFGIAAAVDAGAAAAAIFAAYAGAMLLRWFARTYFYVHDRPLQTVGSDVATGSALFVAAAVMFRLPVATLTEAVLALLVSALAGLAATGPSYLTLQFARFRPGTLHGYARVWRDQSRWSVLGVLTTEATANAHAYLTTFIAGAAAFAPLAASSLLVRPITIAMNALGDFERPVFAAGIAARDIARLRGARSGFRFALAAVGLGTFILAVAILKEAPSIVLSAGYDMTTMLVAIGFWFAISFVRSARMPESIELQAAGEFRPLADASIVSSLASIAIVLAMILSFDPVWSLGGILLGEVVFARQIFRKVSFWRRRWGQELE